MILIVICLLIAAIDIYAVINKAKTKVVLEETSDFPSGNVMIMNETFGTIPDGITTIILRGVTEIGAIPDSVTNIVLILSPVLDSLPEDIPYLEIRGMTIDDDITINADTLVLDGVEMNGDITGTVHTLVLKNMTFANDKFATVPGVTEIQMVNCVITEELLTLRARERGTEIRERTRAGTRAGSRFFLAPPALMLPDTVVSVALDQTSNVSITELAATEILIKNSTVDTTYEPGTNKEGTLTVINSSINYQNLPLGIGTTVDGHELIALTDGMYDDYIRDPIIEGSYQVPGFDALVNEELTYVSDVSIVNEKNGGNNDLFVFRGMPYVRLDFEVLELTSFLIFDVDTFHFSMIEASIIHNAVFQNINNLYIHGTVACAVLALVGVGNVITDNAVLKGSLNIYNSTISEGGQISIEPIVESGSSSLHLMILSKDDMYDMSAFTNVDKVFIETSGLSMSDINEFVATLGNWNFNPDVSLSMNFSGISYEDFEDYEATIMGILESIITGEDATIEITNPTLP